MPYKVHKLIIDKRNNTCGFFIPNGGFYHVVEMTFENHKQLVNISNRPGYSVDYVEGPIGFFDADGFKVDIGSVQVHKINKSVLSYEKETYKYRGKDSQKKVEHIDNERKDVEKQAELLGIKEKSWASTQTLKEIISRSKSAPQRTLTNSAL